MQLNGKPASTSTLHSQQQAHPYTVSSAPAPNATTQIHIHLIRVRNGQTRETAALGDCTVLVVFADPYGHGFPSHESQHILDEAGGTGMMSTYPIAVEFMR
ncbi:hypothetical protein DOTSEDRAFT_29824 [Dothistroma septosporum NZE10]|uniref:Uncharacterized protein n=1 Tax=Dothistroma septosporum (strain NZE10 / CBS 128990) TaxID=675120 RepID=N1Q148_DOTSN|nr:hypothetical protein DOTSEDRAFT_29824 [Dothistroma septosporum NZE10]